MKKAITLPVILLVLFAAVACPSQETEEPAQPEQPAEPEQTVEPEQTAEPAKTPEPVKAPPAPGTIPFAYPPAKSTTAQADSYVLCPYEKRISDGWTRGGDRTTFVYYTSKMVEPGDLQSQVKNLPGRDMTIPNAFIIPIKSGQSAQPGDIVLTWWQSGSGMQRAVVVAGGSPTEPNVRYLDVSLNNPTKVGERVDTLRPDSFHKLSADWSVGTRLACKEGRRYRPWLITHQRGDEVLGIGFAGRMKVLQKASCQALPVRPEVKVGQTVWVPNVGAFYEGTVKRVDSKIGRVFTEIRFGGQAKELAVAFGDVAVAPLP